MQYFRGFDHGRHALMHKLLASIVIYLLLLGTFLQVDFWLIIAVQNAAVERVKQRIRKTLARTSASLTTDGWKNVRGCSI